jgi:hypothetical protein
MAEKTANRYGAVEAQKRFEAALRGARIAGSLPRESLTPKRTKPQQKKRPKKNKND